MALWMDGWILAGVARLYTLLLRIKQSGKYEAFIEGEMFNSLERKYTMSSISK